MTAAARRVSAGTPAGGQFATSARNDAPLTLTAPVPQLADADCLDTIALSLGADEQWSGSADYLEAAADAIASTGRPHPGDWDEDEDGPYLDALTAWYEAEPSSRKERMKDTRAVNRIARKLAASPEWSADELDMITSELTDTGRPACDGQDTGPAYLRALARWRSGEDARVAAAGIEL